MMIAEHGEPKTEQIVKGWVANLATDPLSDDTKAMEYVAAGKCDVTIVNTYYYGRLMKKNPKLPLAIFWPNQDNSGVHVNISGAGVTKYAHHPQAAIKLLEFLSSEKAQNLFADVNNLATDPLSDDTKAMEYVAAGKCDVTIVNTYYYGRLMKKNPKLPLAIFWPNQDNSGVHVNISGAGVTKYAHHPQAAIKLLEFLSSEKAQNLFADVNMEYPVNSKVKTDPAVAAWGSFKQNTINVNKAGELQAEAVKLMDRAGYK